MQTANSCIRCRTRCKSPSLLHNQAVLGIPYLVTGHNSCRQRVHSLFSKFTGLRSHLHEKHIVCFLNCVSETLTIQRGPRVYTMSSDRWHHIWRAELDKILTALSIKNLRLFFKQLSWIKCQTIIGLNRWKIENAHLFPGRRIILPSDNISGNFSSQK